MDRCHAEEQQHTGAAEPASERATPRRARPAKSMVQRRADGAGLPDDLRSRIEQLSGLSMDDVRVHYGSDRPSRIRALGFTQGRDIELASGQEHHLPHEAWHVVQQKQGRVRPAGRVGDVAVNNDQRLEREADEMGARALRVAPTSGEQPTRIARAKWSIAPAVAQRVRDLVVTDKVFIDVSVEVEDGKFEKFPFEGVIVGVSKDGNSYVVTYDEAYCQQDPSYPKEVPEAQVRPRTKKLPLAKVDDKDLSTAPWSDPALGLDDEALTKVKKMEGEARQISWLAEDQLEEMIEFFTASVEERKKAIAKPEPVEPGTDTQLAKRSELLALLTKDLESIQKTAEPAHEVTAREQKIGTDITELEEGAFQQQFGIALGAAEWESMYDAVLKWYAEVKRAENSGDDDLKTFEALFTAHRMSARQINLRPNQGGDSWNVPRFDRKASGPEREMYLDKSVKGIAKRGDPDNFLNQKTKNEAGVHDLSASILNGKNRNIYQQLKPYKEAVVVFMPLPLEKDLQILSALARIKGIPRTWVATFDDLITHPRYAQSSDMHTFFRDTAPDDAKQGTFEYGRTGRVIRQANDRERKINAADMAARRHGALTYTAVATNVVTKVNEIVIAYRKSASRRFPMFAKWSGDEKGNGRFLVLNAPDMTESKFAISNEGVYGPA